MRLVAIGLGRGDITSKAGGQVVEAGVQRPLRGARSLASAAGLGFELGFGLVAGAGSEAADQARIRVFGTTGGGRTRTRPSGRRLPRIAPEATESWSRNFNFCIRPFHGNCVQRSRGGHGAGARRRTAGPGAGPRAGGRRREARGEGLEARCRRSRAGPGPGGPGHHDRGMASMEGGRS